MPSPVPPGNYASFAPRLSPRSRFVHRIPFAFAHIPSSSSSPRLMAPPFTLSSRPSSSSLIACLPYAKSGLRHYNPAPKYPSPLLLSSCPTLMTSRPICNLFVYFPKAPTQLAQISYLFSAMAPLQTVKHPIRPSLALPKAPTLLLPVEN